MRNKFFFTFVMIITFVLNVSAQNTKQEINILTSAQCSMCKTRIETAMAFEKGVVSSSLNLDNKILTIIYKPKKTSPEKLRIALSKVGYDADEVAADPKAYAGLPPCCKKPDDPNHIAH